MGEVWRQAEWVADGMVRGRTVRIYQTESGSFVAVSDGAPRFCFSDPDKDELLATVGRALEFYDSRLADRP